MIMNMLYFFEKEKGFTLIEMILAVSITVAVCAGIVMYVVFSMKTTVDTRQQGDINLNIVSVYQFMQKKVKPADALHVDEYKFYLRSTDSTGSVVYELFDFEPSGEVDPETGYDLPGEFYYGQSDGVVSWTRRLVTDLLSGVEYQLIDAGLVKVVFTYVKGKKLIERAFYFKALAAPDMQSSKTLEELYSLIYRSNP